MKNKYLQALIAILLLVSVALVWRMHGPLFGVLAFTAISQALYLASKPNPYALGAFEIQSSTTGDALATMDPEGVRELWQRGCDIFEQTADFWSPMEGGRNSLVETVTDTSKGHGQKVSFTVRSGFHDEPHMGEELFEEKEDFEERLIDTTSLTVDFIRHATRSTERTEEVMGMRDEIRSHDNEDLGDWMGRYKSESMFMTCLHKVPSDNVIYAGDATTFDTITSDDTINWDEIVGLGAVSKRMGGLPAMVGKLANGKPVFRNAFVATTDALLSLESDPDYKEILENTSVEEKARFLFDGGFTDVRGHMIKEYQPIDHDGEGAIGSPLNPKALLGVAITAATTAFDVKGGGNATSAAKTKKLYFKYFRGHAYRFSYNDTLTADTKGPHYLMIINPPNAPVDPGKFGFYAYTSGNNGNKITITERLAAAAAGIADTTVGGVTWDPLVNTTVHPIGSLILQANSLGSVPGASLMLMRRGLRRGYGKYRNHRSQDTHNGGFVTDRFITSVLGQAPRKDRLGRVPGVFVLYHAINYAGVPTPSTGS